MGLALLITFIFALFVWLVFFKFRWLKFNVAWAIITAFIGLHVLLIFVVGLRFVTPYSANAKVIQHTIQLIPRLPEPTLLTAVLVQPDVPVKKGQALFQFDRRPYEYQVKRLEAQLQASSVSVLAARYKIDQLQAELAAAKQDVRMYKAEMEGAEQKVDQTKSELEYAKYQRELSEGLANKGAGPEEDAQKWMAQTSATKAAVKEATAEADRARLRYKSNINGVNTTVAKTYAELQESKAALQQALAAVEATRAELQLQRYYLDNTTMVAPEDGHIVNLQVQPGMVAGTIRAGGIASFIVDADRYILAGFSQEALKYVKLGQSAEVSLDLYPGQVSKARVESIWWANGQGQYLPSDILPTFYPANPKAPQGEFAVKLYLDRPTMVGLPIGAQGAAAIYTRRGAWADLRRIDIRAHSWINWLYPLTILMKRTSYSGCDSRLTEHSLNRLTWLATSCAFVLMTCSCALHKPPAQATVTKQALPNATPIPPKWSSDPSSGNISDNWVKSFHDPGLEKVVSEAIANNLDLRQSAARVQAARQSVIVVGSQLKPQIGAAFGGAAIHATKSPSGNEEFKSSTAYGVISWEPDVWGRLRAQRAAAQANYEGVALDYAFARQSLAATTAKSWYLAIETRRLLALAEQSVNIYRDLLELAKIRRVAGKVADLDVSEASYELEEARNQLAIIQGQYSEARRSLENLLGRYPSAEISVAEAFAPLPQPVAAGIPSSLLERRPDIMSARQEVLAAFRTQESAKLALLPSFALALEGGHISDRLLDLLHLNPWLVRGAVGMFVPIYRGGALQAQVRIATAQEQQSIANFGSVTLTAFTEVEVALANEELLAQRLPFVENALSDHTETVRVAKLRYQAGAMDLLSVLQLQEGEIASESELIQLRNLRLANRINLHLALGGSFDSFPATSAP